ncbi:GntR family transcriptional regulator [Pararhizobium haloflavum]|uniref:GntR family transcriptional regulator n=1 Tax=Pararhizobium haloflavum TaxID=2037914 RepID=UPI001FDF3791|nr:GntR family transcriptional regulator [Pararhizobium haloflavum]
MHNEERGMDQINPDGGRAARTFSAIRTTDLVTQISRQMTDAIVTGRLKPGERVTELQLSKEFGTSRAPVREAARLLENQGLIVSSPRRGFFVRKLTGDEMRDIYDLRICLELHAAGIAVDRMSESEVTALEKQVERLHELADAGSIEDQIFADFTFHRMLCEASGNKRLMKVYNELAAEMSIGITLIGKLYDDPHRIAETHEPIVAAARRRDREDLFEALRYHIGVAQDHVVSLFRNLERE